MSEDEEEDEDYSKYEDIRLDKIGKDIKWNHHLLLAKRTVANFMRASSFANLRSSISFSWFLNCA